MAMNPYDEFLDKLQPAPGQPQRAQQSQSGQTAPAAAEDSIEAFLSRRDQIRATSVRSSAAATDENPDTVAEQTKAARFLGLPVDVARRNWKSIQRTYDLERIPYESILQSPALAEWGNKPENMAVAKDDLENLGLLEWVTTAPGRAFAQSLNQMRVAELNTKSLYAPLTQEERDELAAARLHSTLGGDLGANSWLAGAVTGGSKLLANVLMGGRSAITYGAVGSAVGATIGAIGGGIPTGGVGAVPGAQAGGGFGFKVGATIGSMIFGFELEAGLALEEFTTDPSFRTADGEQLDTEVARAAALATGVINAGTEAGALAVLFKSFPALKNLRGDITRKAVSQALKSPTVRGALLDLAKGYGTVLTTETATEMGQRAVTIMAGELAKVASGQAIPTRSSSEILDDVLQEGQAALQGFSLLALPGPMLSATTQVRNARAAADNRTFFEALGEGVANSKTVTRLPEAAQEFLQSATEKGGIATVFAPTDTWVTYWQSKNLDPAVMAAELTGDPDSLAEAQRLGTDLQLPTAAYAVKIAGTEHNAFFANELRLNPNGMNQRESDAFAEQAAAMLEAAEAEAETGQVAEGSSLRASVQAQLEGMGYQPEVARHMSRLIDLGELATRAGEDVTAEVLAPLGMDVSKTTLADWKARGGRPGGPPAGAATPAGPETAPPEAIVAPGEPTAAGLATAAGVAEAGGDVAESATGAPAPAAESPVDGAVAPESSPAVVDTPPADPMTAAARSALEPLLDSPDPATLPADGSPDPQDAQGRPDVGTDRRDQAEGRSGAGDATAEPESSAPLERAVPRSRQPRTGEGGPRKVALTHQPRVDQLFADARERGYDGDHDSLGQLYLEALEEAKTIARQLDESDGDAAGINPRDVLKAISALGGFGIEAEAGGNATYKRGKLRGGTGYVGEIEHMLEGLNRNQGVIKKGPRAGQKLPKQFMRHGGLEGLPNIVVRKGGLPADRIFESVREQFGDEAFGGNLAEFMEFVKDAIAIERGDMAAPGSKTYDVRAILEDLLQVRPGVDWWAEAEADPAALELFEQDPSAIANNGSGESSASIEAQNRWAGMVARGETWVKYNRVGERQIIVGVDGIDTPVYDGETFGIEGPEGFQLLDDRGGKYPAPLTVDLTGLDRDADESDLTPGEVEIDTSFDIAAFEQAGGFDLFEGAEVPGDVDILATGEQQPRLPGDVGAVRDQEIADPTLELPEQSFDLTAPEESQPESGDLFQPAWHGSPHIFERFSLQEIGTGEGHQAYGWGLYFASERAVAQGYRDRLTRTSADPNMKQIDINFEGRRHRIRARWLFTWLEAGMIEHGAPEGHARTWATAIRDAVVKGADIKEELAKWTRRPEGLDETEPEVKRRMDTLDALAKTAADLDPAMVNEQPGRLFKVEVPDDDVLLQWDVVDQSPKVRAALQQLGLHPGIPEEAPTDTTRLREVLSGEIHRSSRAAERDGDVARQDAIRAGHNLVVSILSLGPTNGITRDPEVEKAMLKVRAARIEEWKTWWTEHRGKLEAFAGTTGERVYRELQDMIARTLPNGARSTEAAKQASERLNSVGIVGLKYLDGMSRNAGEGSHNFVIFDDNLIQVQEFYQSPAPDQAPLDQATLTTWAEELRTATGPDLRALELQLTPAGDVAIAALEVQRGAARAGLSSSVLQSITRFADSQGKRLTVALPYVTPDDGQAGRKKLEEFYSRFGFAKHRNQLEREPTVSRPAAPKPSLPSREPLVIQHNMTAANLRHTLKLGGLPVPSLAITKASNVMTNFGEITLLGQAEMADPRGYAKTKVYGADVYSPRYPSVHFKFSPAAEKTLTALFRSTAMQTGENYIDLDSLQKEGARYLEQSTTVMAAVLNERGIVVEPKYHEGPAGAVPHINTSSTRYEYDKAIRANGLEDAVRTYAQTLMRQLDPAERIYLGYTDTGNRRYKPHTLENVVKELKKDLRGGETGGNVFGVGQLRAMFTPQFRTLKAIQEASSLIITDEDFQNVKGEIEADLFEFANALAPFYAHSSESFRYTDTVIAVLEESARKPMSKVLIEYGFNGVDDATMAMGRTYLNKLRNTPTEYFEAKIVREVDLTEFAAAVVPAGIDTELVAALRARGLVVESYTPTVAGDRQRAVNDVTAALGDRVLFQDKNEQPRGAIRLQGWPQIEVGLFEGADLSTFLHETGHFYLEVFGDVVDAIRRRPDQTPSQQGLVRDYETMLQWLGVASRAEIGREQHELFARGFETYLFEGIAPAPELRDTFIRFRAWLLSIYQTVKNLGVNLTPEVRGIFDRLIASDQAIAAAQADARVAPMFTTAESAGIPEAEFALYAEQVAAASNQARENLSRRLLEEVQREQSIEWRTQRDAIEQEVTRQVHGQPVYRAMSTMQRGTEPDGTPLLEGLDEPVPMKLSKTILEQRYGKERLKRLPRPYIYTVDGGVDPDLVADMFGFSSGDALLDAVEAAAPMRQVIEAEVNRRMLSDNGSILLDGTLLEQASAAVANAERDRVVRAEIRMLNDLRRQAKPYLEFGEQQLETERTERAYERRWLEAEARLRIAIAEKRKQVEIDQLKAEVRSLRSKARGGAAAVRGALPSEQQIREMAADRIRKTKVRDLQPMKYWNAATKASRRATESAARGDYEGAITFKQQELLNLALYRESMTTRDAVDRKSRRMRDLANPPARARIGLAGHTYLDQLDGFLDRFNFARATKKALDRRKSLVEWIESLKEEGLPAELPEVLLDDALRMPYQELTVDGFNAVVEGIDQIVHLARLKLRLLKQGNQREFEAVRDELVGSIQQSKPERPVKLEYTGKDEKWRGIADWFASHAKVAYLAREMDGGQDGGPMWNAIIRPLNDAESAEQSRRRAGQKRLGDILERHYPKRGRLGWAEKLHIPAIGGSLTKEARLAIALNWGNQTSRDRLLNDPVRKWTRAQIEAILDTLDRRDWEFVQDIWREIDSYWPDIAAKQERVVGLAPEKVEGIDVVTKFGTFRGGYYPLKYDGRMVARAAQVQAAGEAKLAELGAYVRTTTRRGHVETRQSNVQLAVRLDFSVAFEHLDQVIHDLTHHEMLVDVTRLIRDRQVAAAIVARYGDVTLMQFTKVLQDVALGYAANPGGTVDRAATWARTGTQIAMLGWNLWTGVQQPLGLFNGAYRVGPKWVARGLHRWLRDASSLTNTVSWITDVSPMMAARAFNATQDLADLRAQLRHEGGWFDRLVRSVTLDMATQQTITDGFLWHIGLMQRVADVPTWLGAYEKAMHENAADEARAIALADQAVIDSQGSGSVKDLAQVQRGGPVARLFMVFYSYGSLVYNQTREAVGRAKWKSPTSIITLLGDLSLIYVMPAVATVIMANLVGRDDDEDLEEALWNIGGEMFSSALNTQVLLRELGGLFREGGGVRGYEGPAGTRMITLLYRAAGQIKQGEADEAFWRAINAAAGTIFRYPATQVQRTVEGAAAIAEGRTANPAALVFGPPRED